MKIAFLLVAAVALSAPSHGQVVLNEVLPNPSGSSDELYEYVEIYGPPNYDLTGYAVLLLNGGGMGASNPDASEIDEAFSLDGQFTDSRGLFLIYNETEATGFTAWLQQLTPNPDYVPVAADEETRDNQPYLNSIGFDAAGIPSDDTTGNFENDGSTTFVLVRQRPNYALELSGDSYYAPGYAWTKEPTPDANRDSLLDLGDEAGPFFFPSGAAFPDGSDQTGPAMIEPVQIVDEVAWSNGGGLEYNTPERGIDENEINDTPGFSPDGASRLRYYATNPLAGFRLNNDEETVRTSLADESWVYGQTAQLPGSAGFPLGSLVYRFEVGGESPQIGAPTDPSGDGFQDIDADDFPVTPFQFNDAPAGHPLQGGPFETQFRYLDGDFNFDGLVDCLDWRLIDRANRAGYRLDDTAPILRDFDDDNPANDVVYTGYRWQLEGYNALHAMIRQDLSDGSTGDWTTGQSIDANNRIVGWGGVVTAIDLDVFEFTSGLDAASCECAADITIDGSPFDFLQTLALLELAENADLAADLNRDGQIDAADITLHVMTLDALPTTGCGN